MRGTILRWLAICIIVLSTAINYLDRQLLAAVAPALKSEFHLNNAGYGRIQSVFSIAYAFMAPFAGMFIDRVGLNAGASAAVMVWSFASVATGFTRTFSGLLGCRTLLGIAEATGIPSSGKANATYLHPHELALGTGINSIGVSLGGILAPVIAAAGVALRLAVRRSLRAVFLAWRGYPLWWLTSRRVPALAKAGSGTTAPLRDLLARPALLGLDPHHGVHHDALHAVDELGDALFRYRAPHEPGSGQPELRLDSARVRRSGRPQRRRDHVPLDSRRHGSPESASALLRFQRRHLTGHRAGSLSADIQESRQPPSV